MSLSISVIMGVTEQNVTTKLGGVPEAGAMLLECEHECCHNARIRNYLL